MDRDKAYSDFFAAGENLINAALEQMPQERSAAVMAAVLAGRSQLELSIRLRSVGGEMAGDAFINLHAGEQVVELARVEARPGKPPAPRVN